MTPVALTYVIEAAINMAFNEIKYRARLVRDYSRHLPMVLASEGRLSQVFLNLIINATHAIDEGNQGNNEIRIRTWKEGDMVCAQVKDTGSGIAPENLDRLFEPFFTTKKIGVGSGLGLAISKNIIDGYGGIMEVESELGKGSCFTIRLPVFTEKAKPTESEDKEVTASKTYGEILLVDDELGVRDAMAQMLKDHRVMQAESGAEARKLLSEGEQFDVIVCDMMMPDVSGMDLHKWLVETDPDLAKRFIFITGGAFTPRAREYLATLDNIRLEKPFNVTNFKRIVSEFVLSAKRSKTFQ